MVFRDVYVDGVVAVGATDAVNEREVHHLRVLTQPPDVGLVASQTCTVDTALLSGADTDGLTVLDVAYRVRLCVLQSDERDDEVADSLGCEVLCLCGDVLEESWVVELHLVASLLDSHAEYLLVLDGGRSVVVVNLNHVVCTLALCLQNLESLGSEVGSNNAVAHLTLDESSCSSVASVAKRYEVAIRTHAVGTTCTCIGTSDGREFNLNVVDEVYLLQCVAQRQTNCCTCGRYVLERCCCCETCCSLQFLDELP